jgi:acyl carrier protein
MTTSNEATVTDPERREQIRRIVAEILEIDPAELTPTSLFKEEHEADSLRAIEILAALERALKITIDQDEVDRMVNLEGVYAVVVEAGGDR